jgi:methylmalonyl-CoA/ethylmalonyl-CoA epimerase
MTGDQTFTLSKIGQIAVNVRDVARATEFYRATLGLKHLFSAPGLAFFDCGGVRLMLGIPEKPELDHPSSILYFEVEDIQAATAALRNRGVRFEGDPHRVAQLERHDVWLAEFRDSEENVLALMSHVPRA